MHFSLSNYCCHSCKFIVYSLCQVGNLFNYNSAKVIQSLLFKQLIIADITKGLYIHIYSLRLMNNYI